MNLQVDEAMIRAAVEKKVSEAVFESMVDKDAVLDRLITKMLNLKVNSDGKPSEYSNGTPYIEWAAQDAMRKAVQAGMKAAFDKKEQEIAKLVEAQIVRSKSKIAQSLVSGMIESLKTSWATTVKLNFKELDR